MTNNDSIPGHRIVEKDEFDEDNFNGIFERIAGCFSNHLIDIPFSHLFSLISHRYPFGQQ